MDNHPGGSVLVVEDRPNWQEVLRDLIMGEGYDVQVAGDAEEALRLLSEGDYVLVVLDMRLTELYSYGMQGLDVLKQAKLLGIRTLILTGFEVAGLQARTRELGADSFMVKSADFQIGQFRRILSSLAQS